jgi:hypothetical protein
VTAAQVWQDAPRDADDGFTAEERRESELYEAAAGAVHAVRMALGESQRMLPLGVASHVMVSRREGATIAHAHAPCGCLCTAAVPFSSLLTSYSWRDVADCRDGHPAAGVRP